MGVVEQKFPIINAVHIIIRCKASGNVKLSHEHEGFAWVEPAGLSKYRLADWLADFVKDIKVERKSERSGFRDILGFIRRN